MAKWAPFLPRVHRRGYERGAVHGLALVDGRALRNGGGKKIGLRDGSTQLLSDRAPGSNHRVIKWPPRVPAGPNWVPACLPEELNVWLWYGHRRRGPEVDLPCRVVALVLRPLHAGMSPGAGAPIKGPPLGGERSKGRFPQTCI